MLISNFHAVFLLVSSAEDKRAVYMCFRMDHLANEETHYLLMLSGESV